ncbi:MAG: NUDIX hydrolase [Terricaulis sp.]
MSSEGAPEQGWVFRNRFIRVRNEPVIFPGGIRGEHVSVHPACEGEISGVVMLPYWDGRFVLCRNFRHPTRRWMIETPRGSLDQSEDPPVAARRELLEEYGVEGHMELLGRVSPDDGLLAADALVYWCTLAALPEAVGEHHKMPPLVWDTQALVRAIANGEVQDGFLISGLMLAIARGVVAL